MVQPRRGGAPSKLQLEAAGTNPRNLRRKHSAHSPTSPFISATQHPYKDVKKKAERGARGHISAQPLIRDFDNRFPQPGQAYPLEHRGGDRPTSTSALLEKLNPLDDTTSSDRNAVQKIRSSLLRTNYQVICGIFSIISLLVVAVSCSLIFFNWLPDSGLSPVTVLVSVNSSYRLLEDFHNEFRDNSSVRFQRLKQRACYGLMAVYKTRSNTKVDTCDIMNLRPGSTIFDSVIFLESKDHFTMPQIKALSTSLQFFKKELFKDFNVTLDETFHPRPSYSFWSRSEEDGRLREITKDEARAVSSCAAVMREYGKKAYGFGENDLNMTHFAYIGDCRKYIQCDFNSPEHSKFSNVRNCPEMLVWNDVAKTCDLRDNVPRCGGRKKPRPAKVEAKAVIMADKKPIPDDELDDLFD